MHRVGSLIDLQALMAAEESAFEVEHPEIRGKEVTIGMDSEHTVVARVAGMSVATRTHGTTEEGVDTVIAWRYRFERLGAHVSFETAS